MSVTAAAIYCLSLNIFFEAGISPPDAQYAVAFATMTEVRSHRKPNVCRTVLRGGRYVWVRDKLDSNGTVLPQHRPHGINWTRAQHVARRVLKGDAADFTRGATHFYATIIDPPYWVNGATFVAQYGTIRFYKNVP